MKKTLHLLLFLLLAPAVLTACATPDFQTAQGSSTAIAAESEKQKIFVLQQSYKNQLRLQRVALPLLTRNTALCGKKISPYYGFATWTLAALPANYRKAAQEGFKLDDRIAVSAVVPQSPAAHAGLLRGDKILRINKEAAKTGRDGLRQIDSVMQTDKHKLALTILRHGKTRTVILHAVPACAFGLVLSPDEAVNASADGKNIIIPQGMMRFAAKDDELALVISHEMGHDVAGHIKKKELNEMGAGLLGLIADVAARGNGDFTRTMMNIGAQAYSVQFEQEADYLGLYMMRRAGYPIKNAAQFWRRMAANSPTSIEMRTTHPTSPERFVALEKTVAEIETKEAKGLPLLPNRKPGTSTAITPASAHPFND